MKVIGTLLIFVVASLVLRAEACDPSMVKKCTDDFSAVLATNSEIDQLCKVKDSALSDLEKCVSDAGCSTTQYVDPHKEAFDTSYAQYCQPGCEDYTQKAMGFANCSLLAAEVASMPNKLCEIMQKVSDCMYEQVNGCPILEQQYGNITLQTLMPFAGSCKLTYGGEPVGGDATGTSGCYGTALEVAKCQPENAPAFSDANSIDFNNKESCKILESVDLAAYKKCLQDVEKKAPECFYPLEDSTDVGVVNSGKFPLVSGLIDVAESLCSAECDNLEQANKDVAKCLPKASAEVMSALNVTSQMTSGQAKAECTEIEKWVKKGADCAQGLVGDCKALEYGFNLQGLEGLVMATQNLETSNMFVKSQKICQVKFKVTVEDETNNASGLLRSSLTVFVAILAMMQLV